MASPKSNGKKTSAQSSSTSVKSAAEWTESEDERLRVALAKDGRAYARDWETIASGFNRSIVL